MEYFVFFRKNIFSKEKSYLMALHEDNLLHLKVAKKLQCHIYEKTKKVEGSFTKILENKPS